jgi:signal transduction histidine kinase
LRDQSPDELAALAEHCAAGGQLPAWASAAEGEWLAARLAGGDQPIGWLVAWNRQPLAEHERGDRHELVREVAGRLALVLERDTLLEEAARVEALRAVDRAKSDFLAIAAHELRTPLTSLQGYAELLRSEVEPGVRDRWLGILQLETAQLSQVLEQLLATSQLDTGQLHAQRRPFELQDVIARVIEEFGPQAALTQHHLRQEVAPGLPRALADPGHIERVLRSLVSNALKYSPHGGEVWIVAVQRAKAELEVCVQDDGLGIPAEWLGRLFERFQRVDLPDRASIRGTGLGLYIARQLVEVNGGRIWAASDGAGCGASFHFMLAAEPLPHRA